MYLSRIDLDAFRKHWRFYVMVGVSCAIARYFDSHHGRTLPWSGNGMRFEGYVITQALSCVSLTAGSLVSFSIRHLINLLVGVISQIHPIGSILSTCLWFYISPGYVYSFPFL